MYSDADLVEIARSIANVTDHADAVFVDAKDEREALVLSEKFSSASRTIAALCDPGMLGVKRAAQALQTHR